MNREAFEILTEEELLGLDNAKKKGGETEESGVPQVEIGWRK